LNIFGHVKRIFFEILPAFIFFFVMFNMLSFSRALILRQYGIVVSASAIATIGALIMAKVVFHMNRLPFLNLYPRKPLLYNVMLKTVVFSIFALIFLILEEMLRFSIKTGSVSAAWEHLVGDINWPVFWLKQVWFIILIAFYCAAMELAHVLGIDKVKSIFLKSQR
jgi:hypothetical protein